MDLKLAKSHVRLSKSKIRRDYEWDGNEANLGDLVSKVCKTFLFPC
jgi:hypothetical protein